MWVCVALEPVRAAAWCVVLHPASFPCRVVTRWGDVVMMCRGRYVWPLEPVSYRGRLLGVVVTHRCGRLHPDCPVMMSGWLQSFHTLQANSTSMPVAALGGNSVGWCAGGGMCGHWYQSEGGCIPLHSLAGW